MSVHPGVGASSGVQIEDVPTMVHVRDPWAIDAQEVVAALGSDADRGLDPDEARHRLIAHGPNELEARAAKPAWRLLAEQFTNAMILVLLGAAAITAAIGDLKDTAIILVIVVLNGLIGFVQEYRAGQAMDALKRMTSPSARVVRAGVTSVVPAAELVPGDLVRLDAGDVVTADMRLVEARSLRINEAALTGESEPASKMTAPIPDVTAAVLADQRNMAFSGTAVTYGRGLGLVVATGMETALGRVAELLEEHGSGQTPLQRRLSTLGKRLAIAAFLVCIFVFVSGVARGEPADVMFLTAVSLAVAAIPEGLPAVVTIALALGARRMAQRHALVRKLPAVETLGSVTVVCSDKTGTLTENRMLAERVWTPNGDYRVSGDGYAPTGRFDPQPANDTALERLAQVAAACNDASLHAPATSDDPWTISGDPTEAALLALAAKLEVDPQDSRRRLPAGRRADVRPGAATDGDHSQSRCGGLGRREGRPGGDRPTPRSDRGRPAAAGRAGREATPWTDTACSRSPSERSTTSPPASTTPSTASTSWGSSGWRTRRARPRPRR